MQRGYLKLWRKIQEHRVYQNADLLKLFLHLLMNANIVDKSWNGDLIRRGELATGREGLARDLRVPPSTLYKRLRILSGPLYDLIGLRSNSNYTVITVLNYDTYQPSKLDGEQQGSSEVAARWQQGSTTKELKNKEEEEIQETDPGILAAGSTARKEKVTTWELTAWRDMKGWKKRYLGLPVEKELSKTVELLLRIEILPSDMTAFFTKYLDTMLKHRSTLEDAITCDLLQDPKFADSWESFMDMRRDMKAPATKRAQSLILKSLEQYPVSEAIEMVNNSVVHNWKGVFPLKGTHGTPRQDRPKYESVHEHNARLERERQERRQVDLSGGRDYQDVSVVQPETAGGVDP